VKPARKTRHKHKRGKKYQQKDKEAEIKIFFCSIRGIKSKIDSVREIMKMCLPDIAVFNETFLEKEETVRIDGLDIKPT